MADLVSGTEAHVIPAHIYRKRREDSGRGERFPYDAWADGKPRRAFEGLDFGPSIRNGVFVTRGAKTRQSFRTAIYAWANQWGTQATIENDGPGCVIFTIAPLAPERVAQRDRMYGPYLYDFDHERGYVTQSRGAASPPTP
jgi:hypothetical protein